MATPKPPADIDESLRENSRDPLDDSINKLEILIKDSDTEHSPGQDIQIPVLDDIVETDDPDLEIAQHSSMNTISLQQLSELVDDIEGRLTGELDALVDLLKDSIKDNIMDEIKTQLNAGLKQKFHDKED